MKRRSLVSGAICISLNSLAMPAFSMNDKKMEKKILVVYFSKTNHTKNVAETISRLTGADLLRVDVVEPYPEAYRATTEVVKKELEENIIRKIKAPSVDLSKYDVIVFGTPTWWHHVSMPLQTWIKENSFKGKTVATYNTDGGGGTMHTEEDFQKLLKGNKLLPHMTIFGSNDDQTAELSKWLKEINLIK